MIYGSSSDPVLIKKISLKIWTLREEIEAVIRQRAQHVQGEVQEGHKLSHSQVRQEVLLEDLSKEYTLTHTPPAPTMPAPAGPGLIQGVDAVSTPQAPTAPADADTTTTPAADGEATAATETNPSADAGQSLMADALNPETAVAPAAEAPSVAQDLNENVVTIYQRRPHIPEEALAQGRMILSEIDIGKLYCFCTKRFLEGQSILIEFLVPKRFILSATVTYCRSYTIKGRILREKKLVYRLMAKFTFERPGERTLLRQFLQSVTPDIPTPKKKAKPVESNDGDSGDDLSDLDL